MIELPPFINRQVDGINRTEGGKLWSQKIWMGAKRINLQGTFITHKVYGRGQIVEHGTDFVTILFTTAVERKKFVYPSAIGTFLVLEDAETAKWFKEQSDALQNHDAAERKAAAERVTLEKRAALDKAKALKKGLKKPAKKAKPAE